MALPSSESTGIPVGSKKDIILVEALKSDGIEVSKKYKDLYQVNESEMPTDIQAYINNQDMASALLRIVQVIGQDQLIDIDPETMYFIISTSKFINFIIIIIFYLSHKVYIKYR